MASEILTEDVLIEILARLPVKSLIRFTCVCKYWLSLIKSHDFATKHYATRLGILSHTNSEFDCFLTTFFPACSISTFRCENIYDMSFQSAFKIRPAVPCEPPRLGINHRDVIRQCAINGPCNGLFCLNLVKDNLPVLLLWNPATREVFKPPENSYQNGGAVIGLGYDPLSNDYKLLNFHGNGWGPSDPSIVSVYSLAANRWRPLDSGIHFQAPAIVVLSEHSSFNGSKLHFPLRFKSTSNKTISLLSFDIVDEVFVQTSMPDDVATGRAQLGGFLFQGTKDHDPTIYSLDFKDRQDPVEIRIWALNGYGPSGVWNEQRIALPSLIYATAERMLWKNMDIVIGYKMDGTITAYDFTTQQYHQMESPLVPGNGRIIGYTESLVSIATFIRQPPSAHHSAVEDHSSLVDIDPEGLMQDQSSVEMGLQGFIQDCLSFEFEQHGVHHHSSVQAQEQEDDDDGGLSTDSAFLMPERQDFWESDMEFDDFEINDEVHPYRLKETERLSKLPYCLREVNQPMISNPCTF